jgi:hypothetical protein
VVVSKSVNSCFKLSSFSDLKSSLKLTKSSYSDSSFLKLFKRFSNFLFFLKIFWAFSLSSQRLLSSDLDFKSLIFLIKLSKSKIPPN